MVIDVGTIEGETNPVPLNVNFTSELTEALAGQPVELLLSGQVVAQDLIPIELGSDVLINFGSVVLGQPPAEWPDATPAPTPTPWPATPTPTPQVDEGDPAPTPGQGPQHGGTWVGNTASLDAGTMYEVVRDGVQDGLAQGVEGREIPDLDNLDITGESELNGALLQEVTDKQGQALQGLRDVTSGLRDALPPSPNTSQSFGQRLQFSMSLPRLGAFTLDLTPYAVEINWWRQFLLYVLTVINFVVIVKILRGSSAS